jgi:TetR/AcrR family transcriptional regulator, transcriptional repressor of aconitase
MPRITPARAQMRRRQIMEAALNCFARLGFHKTTMQDIVKQSKLSPGAIYCHFASKHAIIVAVVQERHRREGELVHRASRNDNFASAFDDLVRDFISVLGDSQERTWRRLTIQLWAESLHDRRLAVAVRQGVDEPRAMLAGMIRRAKSRGELPQNLNEDATARLLIGVFQGLVLQNAWDGDVDAAACTDALATLIGLRGACARP